MNRYTFSELIVGMQASFSKTVTQADMDAFYSISGDCNPLHRDEAFARSKNYLNKVVYGMLTASLYPTLAGVYLPGENCLLQSVNAQFLKPVYPGDTLTVTGVISELNDSFSLVMIKASIVNQNGEKVSRASIQAGVI